MKYRKLEPTVWFRNEGAGFVMCALGMGTLMGIVYLIFA